MINLTFATSRTQVGSLIFDALVTEEITLDGEVSLYPIEDGSLITDNVFRGAERLTITGRVSTGEMTFLSLSPGLGKGRLVDAIDLIRSMHRARALITVTTGIQQYTDMGIASLTATRVNENGGGNWLEVRADLVRVEKVSLQTAEVPAAAPARGRTGQTQKPAGRNSGSSSQTSGTETGAKNTTAAGEVFNRFMGILR